MKLSYDIVVAKVEREGRRNPLEIRCKKWPLPTELDLLYVLTEQFGKIVPLKTLHERLNVANNSLRVRTARLRSNLDPVWAIESVLGVGIRIIYVGEPPKAKVDIDYDGYIEYKINRLIENSEARSKLEPVAKKRTKKLSASVSKTRAQQMARRDLRVLRMRELRLEHHPGDRRVRLHDN